MSDIVKLIYAELDENSNKFWEAEVDASSVTYRWGRIGDGGQSKTKQFFSPYQAVEERNKMVRKKLAKGYTHQKTVGASPTSPASPSNLGRIAREQIDHGGDPDTQELIKFLVARNIHAIEGASAVKYDARTGSFTTPLGLITEDGLDEAKTLLERISAEMNAGADSSEQRFGRLVSQYLRIIPAPIARRSPRAVDIFPNDKAVAKQYDLVENLWQALDLAAEPQDDGQPAPSIFQAKLSAVAADTPEWDKLTMRFRKSINRQHQSAGMSLKRAWGVDIAAMTEAFEQDGRRMEHVMELWHGTKDSNLLSILRSGYVIPRQGTSIRITGRMYGNGLYFSDQSTKSLNYATDFWGGGGSKRAFMLLNRVAMGHAYVPQAYGGSYTYPKPRYDSTFAKAGQSGVRNNEMIVYRTSQVCPVYLCEFS